MNFIKRMILENWTAVSENDSEYDSLWTLLNNEDNIKDAIENAGGKAYIINQASGVKRI